MAYSSQGSHIGQLDFCNYKGIKKIKLTCLKINVLDNNHFTIGKDAEESTENKIH